MFDFWQKLRGHTVLQAALAYLMVSWVVMQIGEVVGPALLLPDWALTALLYILLLGFPIVMLVTWQLSHNKKQAAGDVGAYPGRTRRTDFILYVGAGLVCVFVLMDWLRGPSENNLTETELAFVKTADESDSKIATQDTKSDALIDQQTIAVLPFVDLSPERDQEYFADGMTEEIINALYGVPGLRVTSRTSSFSFKGKNEEIPKISEALRVANILEGSVRKQGSELRITAQLIEGKTGFHIWSDTFDSPMNDVFKVQQDIAEAIAAELEVYLDLPALGTSVPKTTDAQAYELYLEARSLMGDSKRENLLRAEELLTDALNRDPEFGHAWAALANVHLASMIHPGNSQLKLANAQKSIELALQHAPDVSEAHAARGWVEVRQRHYSDMEEHFQKALALNENDVIAMQWYANGLISVGKPSEAAKMLELAGELDPFQPKTAFFHATALMMSNNTKEAERAARRAIEMDFHPAKMVLADVAYLRGEHDTAVGSAQDAYKRLLANHFTAAEAELLLRGVFHIDPEAEEKATALILEKFEGDRRDRLFHLVNFLVMLGEAEAALEFFEASEFDNDMPFFVALWGPKGAAVRQHPAFQEFARRIGLVEYWEQHGWPEKCQPTGQVDGNISFSCV